MVKKYLKDTASAVGKLLFGLYLFVIAVFGGAYIAEFAIYNLSKRGIVILPADSTLSMGNLCLLLGLFIGSPIIVYVIRMYIPKTRDERTKV
jgi:hypothetical protein